MPTKDSFLIASANRERDLSWEFGFDEMTRIWSDDEAVRTDLRRLCGFAIICPMLGIKTFDGLDLSGEKPFNLSTAVFEDCSFQDTRFPKGTDLSAARFVGCNVLDLNFEDCITERAVR